MPPDQAVVAIEPPLDEAHGEHDKDVAEVCLLPRAEREETIVDEDGQYDAGVQGHGEVPVVAQRLHPLLMGEGERQNQRLGAPNPEPQVMGLVERQGKGGNQILRAAERRAGRGAHQDPRAVHHDGLDRIDGRVVEDDARLPRGALPTGHANPDGIGE